MEDPFQSFITKYECILNNKNESFENKIASLIEVWRSIAEPELPEFDIKQLIQIMDWAKLHALNIVLTAEWNNFKEKYQDRLLKEIEKAQNELLKLNTVLATPCKKLADVVRNPWEDPILMKLMKEKDADIGSEEIEFFCVETAYLVSVRLKKLCESQCEDLALNLVTAFMNCNKLSKSQNFNMNATETQMWFIFDIYIALLYKFQEKHKMAALLKELSFDEGLQLVKRFAKKRVKISKIWKNCQRIAIFALQMYISQAVLKYSNDLQPTLEQYIELYISLCNADNLQDFSDSIRRISNLADAAGLYVFCDVIQRKAGQKLKPFTIEMYIRALTTDMNELERQKDAKDTEKVQMITQRLADAFVSLASFLDEHVNVARECVLTAFSLAPTSDRLKKIEELAKRSGFQVVSSELEWKCRLHPPALPTDEITWICPECGDWMCKPSLDLPKINIALHEALQNSVLGISEALCDDLVVCLSNPRYQILSWFLPWNDLHRLCRMYLQDPQNTKNIVTELKFVDIDYSIFKDIKREPLDELAGIERGYEQYLDQNFVSDEESISNSEDSMSQDSRPYSLGSDGAGDSLFLPLLPTTTQKSDPNTLKSLRMFRPNLKRLKEKDPGESTPEKVFKPSTIVRESQASTSDQNLSSVSSEGLPSTTSPTDDSKNVKTATLPQLGGQVARTEIKPTQEHQKLTLKDVLSCSLNLVHLEPQKLSKEVSLTKPAEQIPNQKIQNKPLLIGSNENSKQTPNKEVEANRQHPSSQDMKIIVKISKKESDLCQTHQKKDHPLQSVLVSSKVGTSIHSSEQISNVDNQDSPALVVKTPLISYPPHRRHRKAVLKLLDELEATTPCISSNTQQTKAIGEPCLPILAPPSTQQEINSRLSATQSMISLQQKSQSACQQTVTLQANGCQTEVSTKNSPSSPLDYQLGPLAAANSRKQHLLLLARQEPQPNSATEPSISKFTEQRQVLMIPVQQKKLQMESPPQTAVNTKPACLKETTHSSQKTSQVECERQEILKIQTSRLHPEATPLPNSHPQIIEEKSQLGSHCHTPPVRPQEVKCPQAGSSPSHHQNLLPDNIAGVACPQPTLQKESQLTTLPENQREVSLASHSQILQVMSQLDSLCQSTSLKPQEINLLQIKPAVIQQLEVKTQSLLSPEEVVLLKNYLLERLNRIAELEQQRANLQALMTNKDSSPDPTPPQWSPLSNISQTAATSPSTLLDSQGQLTSPKSQETNLPPTKMMLSPPRHLQTTVKAALTYQETSSCQKEMNRAPQQKSALGSQPQVELQKELESLNRLADLEQQRANLQALMTNQLQQIGESPDSTPDPTPPQWSPLSNISLTAGVSPPTLLDCQGQLTSPKTQETNLSPSKMIVTPPRHLQTTVKAALTYQETKTCQKEMNRAPQQKSLLDSEPQVMTEVVSPSPPTLQEKCQTVSRHPSTTLTSQNASHSQPESRVTSHQEPHTTQLDRHPQSTINVDQSMLQGHSQLNIQSPVTKEPSLLKMKPNEDQCLPRLRVVISRNSQLSAKQLRCLKKRRGRPSRDTQSQKRRVIKKKIKRLGQISSSNIPPKKRGRPKKNRPSILPSTNLPTTTRQDSSDDRQPENTYRVCLLTPAAPAPKPLVIPKEMQKYLPQPKPKPVVPQPSTSQQPSCTIAVSPRRIKSSRSLIASIRKEEWPLVPQWPYNDEIDMFDASRILQDFFSRKRTPSPEPPPQPIHTHSTKSPSFFVQIQQPKTKDVPYLVEENEDLSCLTDPTQEAPTIAFLQGQVCLFHHKRLRVGKGVPSLIYQRTVEQQKKYLEIWTSDSSDGEESEMELEMEDKYRRKSAFFGLYPDTWAMWVDRPLPRRSRTPPPPSPPKKNKRSTKGKKPSPPPPPPKRSLKAQPSSSSTRPTATTSSTRTVMGHKSYPTGSNMAGAKRPMMYVQPSCVIDLTKDDDDYEYEEINERKKLAKRRMRKARRIIRREKAERAIIDEMKRMSELAINQLRNGKPDDPLPEVVDLDLFIEFLKNRGRTPLLYRRLPIAPKVPEPHTQQKPSCSTAVTKELSVKLCRLSLEQLQELNGKANKVENQVTTKKKDTDPARKSLGRPKKSNKSCDSDFNGNRLPAKGEDKMTFGKGEADDDSDLENSNLQNTDHESNQKASCDINSLDRRVPRVLLENIAAKSLLANESNQKASCDINLLDERVPRVLLENIAAKSLLANVPGLNDFHLMQPQNVDHIINVVQVSGVKTQMQSTSQTSTPVTAHIQRIGQPRPSEQKPENSTVVATSTPVSTNISNVVTSSSTGHTTTKSQPSTLINILSQQVIRPANIVPSSSTITGNSNGHTISTSSGNNSNSTSSSGNSSSTTTPTRRPPFINILSQQIIRPTQASKGAPNNGAYTVTETVLPKTQTQTQLAEPISSTVNNLTRPTITTTTIIPKTTSVVTTSQGIASGNISSSIPDSASNSPGTTVGNTQGSTIVQFICKSALPKFQQAFGKTVYQCTAETTESSTVSESTNAQTATICTIPVSTVTSNTEIKKNVTNVAKAVPVNVQSIQGNVIYSRQVPVGQTINLVPPTGATRQVFRIAASNPEQLNLVKDSVIHSKMSALLAAALQSRPKNTETEIQVQDDGTKITLTRPALVQNARIVKPVQLQLPTNVVRAPQPNLSSTTLEQLREFDMVYKQIKERSSNTTPTEISTGEQTQEVATPQRISVTYVNQLPKYTQLSPVVVVSSYSHLQQAATSPALSVTSQSSLSPCTTPTSTPSTAPKITTKTTKGKTFKNHTNNSTTKTSPISKPQQKPQEDEHTTQRIFDILAEYAEQLRNSPDLNNKPAPRRRSNPPTNPSQNSKRKKNSSGTKKTAPANSNVDIDTDDITVGSEDSSGGGIVQLSVTDDEQSQSQAATTSTVESSEATTPTCPRQVILTDNSSVGGQARNVIIADSSVGEALKMSNTAVIVPGSYIMPVSMVKGGQQIAVMSGGSKILATVPARSGQNMLLFQSFTNQNRKGAISAVKYSSLQSVSGISSQSIAGVSAQPPVILPSNSVATAVAIGQQLALKKIGEEREGGEVLLTISQKEDTQPDSVTSVSSDSEDVKIPDQSNMKVDHPSEKIIHTYQKPISTNKSHTVIATSITQKVHQEPCAQPTVISTAKVSTTLNGPMLSHTTANRFRKVTDSERTIIRGSEAKEDSTHNGAKVTNTEPKTYRSSAIYYTNKAKKVAIDSQKPESDAQKQAMLERELRLQKSLSEECEDLGVDEPSTSDLFPEADLLFDSNHSPSFDQNSQEGVKKGPHGTEKEEGTKSSINLFSDDDNSSSLKSDLFEYVEYHTVESALDHQAKQLMNGNNPETESSSCEDNTLLPKCSNMSEVTLNSPISPEVYAESSVNKYKFKYTNRKKSEKIKQNDSGGETITNSEDAVSSADSCKLSSEEENYKVVHVAITKSDVAKEENRCELHVCEEFVDSPSGRGARRSVRKLCSCCNGAQDGHHAARKRPNPSRPQTPATPHKKPFLKKR